MCLRSLAMCFFGVTYSSVSPGMIWPTECVRGTGCGNWLPLSDLGNQLCLGTCPCKSRGVVVSAHWQSGYWPVAPSGQRSSVVNDDWHGASLSMPSLNWIRNHAGEVVTSNGGGRGSSRKVPSSVRGQGGLLFLNKSDLKVLNTKGGGMNSIYKVMLFYTLLRFSFTKVALKRLSILRGGED